MSTMRNQGVYLYMDKGSVFLLLQTLALGVVIDGDFWRSKETVPKVSRENPP